jgi:carbamoyl-phosphate synthase small subunit
MKALLALEDGLVLEGRSFGAQGEAAGELVFNTSMTGYQEVLTDPSYKGQIVTMTYPLIGNYGVNSEDFESRRPWVEGFVVKEASRTYSNWRAEKSLDEFLIEHGIVGIQGIDTRSLTRHIRTEGAMKGIISTKDNNKKRLIKKAKESPGLIGLDLVKDVTCSKSYYWTNGKARKGTKKRPRVVVMDFGVKYNILRNLEMIGCEVVVVPASSSSDEILSHKPDGLLLSNGPGDPEGVPYAVNPITDILQQNESGHIFLPTFGICFGHQLLGLAFGGKTYKLKFGHHGANHPVKDLQTGKVAITVQNHGFCVDMESLDDNEIELTHINLNDNTLEGMEHKKLPVFSVQFHPEASPGPHDAKYLFQKFRQLMDRGNA